MNKDEALKLLREYEIGRGNERVVFSKGESRIESLGWETRALLKNSDLPDLMLEVNRLWDDGQDFHVDYSDGIIKYVGRME